MRLFVICCLIVFAVWAIVFLFAGRQISLFLDQFGTVRLESFAVSPIAYDSGSLRIGGQLLVMEGSQLSVTYDSRNHLVLSAGGRDFPLGTRTNRTDPDDPRMIEFVPDADDETSFTIDRSRLSWPTPFELNFMTGHVSSWRRHLYYRLHWKKATGATLKMVWRYEQWFYGTDGWTKGLMTHADTTGLIALEILPLP